MYTMDNLNREYKCVRVRSNRLNNGDTVLSCSAFYSDTYTVKELPHWFSFVFIRGVRNGRMAIRMIGKSNSMDYYYQEPNSLFYKVEKDFPYIWGQSILLLNINIPDRVSPYNIPI